MKIIIDRFFKGTNYTIGRMHIDGKYFCDTLEDTVRALPKRCPYTPQWRSCICKEKIYGQTAIPTGTYKVTLEMSPRFKRKLPYLHDVHHFLGILIHRGNTPENTEGCILVGENKVVGKVVNSTPYEVELVRLIDVAEKKGEKVTIELR